MHWGSRGSLPSSSRTFGDEAVLDAASIVVLSIYDGALGRELLRELGPSIAVVVWARERLWTRVDDDLDLLHAQDDATAAPETQILQIRPVVVVQDG